MLSKFNSINQVSVFYVNVKVKLIRTFVTLQKILTKPDKLQPYKLLKSNKSDIYGKLIDKFFTYTLSTYTTIMYP